MRKKALAVTIVIPVYNEEGYLKACLDSIASQIEPADEVIVVDNNSTDKTLEIAKSYDFVRVLAEKKQGVVHVRNTGFDAATGDIIGRIDGDTLLPNDWVWQVKKSFALDEELAAVSGPVSYYDMPLEPLNLRMDMIMRWLVDKTHNTRFLFGTNMAIRKSAWKQIRTKTCTTSQVHEDLDLAIHLQFMNEKVLYTPNLRARMSARRFDDPLPKFYHYLQAHKATFDQHGIRTSFPLTAKIIYISVYMLLKPMRRAYNPVTGRFSLRHFMFGYNQPRRHPM